MGRIVFCSKFYSIDRTPFNAPIEEIQLVGKVASNAGKRGYKLLKEKDVETFSLKISSVFKGTVQGIDILQSSDDGKAYALEVNMGNTWAFSSKLGENIRSNLGVEPMLKQYNMFEVVSDAIIEEARANLAIS